MNKIEEILQSKETYDPEYPTISISDAIEAMDEFGRLAFEAGRDQYWDDGGTGCLEFKHDHYEEFLREIEDERN